ncbi:ester cyclase [Tetragenococcus halophilus]|uniref:Uncharacterized protein n=2 Tax=Tetragenococcus halophilus TaxID=51669 RepID=A0A2H6D4R3_TETHA|nr:ester cyclase [Tetragenococcus halophilus]NRR74816.1 ester cyclase [Tetragenococcus halophilus]QXN86712.1 ester cyclase [Tetragenococcus halophilus]RQD29656.1 hypothetical protein C7K42_12450 [Tetragenococcus halophilus subsp. halophilus DSM 20339]WJS81789.1 ester cyclase [Tetragenococcus halophilus]BAK95634.1 hypothetical protein TEH_23070 [Tetragenococcus halophilus NBRC 12172]
MNGKEIYSAWVRAWNEDINILDGIVDKECVVHQARTDNKKSDELKGIEAVKNVIQSSAAYFNDISMTLVVTPIEENNYVSARWNFKGRYNGEMQGARAKKGTSISFEGTDIFFIKDGKIKDYWVSSDVMDFMNQLEML